MPGHLHNAFYAKVWNLRGLHLSEKVCQLFIATAAREPNVKKAADSSDATNRISPWVIEFKGKMWIIGGDYNHLTTGDIWSSDNGSDWQLVNDSTPFALGGATGFTGPQIVVFQDKLWAIEGSKVWSSPDGVAWTMITDKPGYPVRLEFKTVVLNKRLVLFGGTDPATAQPKTDVWTSEDGWSGLSRENCEKFRRGDLMRGAKEPWSPSNWYCSRSGCRLKAPAWAHNLPFDSGKASACAISRSHAFPGSAGCAFWPAGPPLDIFLRRFGRSLDNGRFTFRPG